MKSIAVTDLEWYQDQRGPSLSAMDLFSGELVWSDTIATIIRVWDNPNVRRLIKDNQGIIYVEVT